MAALHARGFSESAVAVRAGLESHVRAGAKGGHLKIVRQSPAMCVASA